MTATNHALTGAVIGLAISIPWIALPAALVSHLVIDAIPHFGIERAEAKWLRSKKFRVLLVVEAAVCIGIVISLYLSGSSHWLLAATCAFVAASPDLFWIDRFRRALKRQPLATHYQNPIKQLHRTVQWFQKPIGLVVEAAWALLCVALLSSLLVSS